MMTKQGFTRLKQNTVIAVLIPCLLCACGKKAGEPEKAAETVSNPPVIVVNSTEEVVEDHTEEEAEAILQTMSLDEKIAQMVMPAIRVWGIDDPKPVTKLNEELTEAFQKHAFGGVILFAQNLTDTEQTVKLTDALQEANHVSDNRMPLLVAADQEGGSVTRLAQGISGPGNMALGATGDVTACRSIAEILGEEMTAQGINTDFAPVLDINSDPSNPVIGIRSFSDDPKLVADCGKEFIDGLNAQNVVTSIKHFPGHGDTDTDSHAGLPCIDKPLAELKETELVPFSACLADTDMVMTAHIEFPQIEQTTYISKESGEEILLPATLSKTVITDLLRTELGFDGVVITDSLEMGAITKHFDRLDAAKLAINAGADMLLMPATMRSVEEIADMDAYLMAIKGMVENGEIPAERIDEAVRRILIMKIRNGLKGDAACNTDVAHAMEVTGSVEHLNKEWELACSCVTMLKNDGMAIPSLSNGKTVILLPDESLSEYAQAGLQRLKDEGLMDEGADVSLLCYQEETKDAAALVRSVDRIIAVSTVRKRTQLDPDHKDGAGSAFLDGVIRAAKSQNRRLTLISAALPYDTARYQDADAILACYNGKVNLSAAIFTAFGGADAPGRLPVAVPALTEDFQYADRIMYERGYSLARTEGESVTLGDEQFDAYLPLLSGKKIALFSNHTGIVGDSPAGKHILDELIQRGVDVEVVFAPEHGFRGTADAGEDIDDGVDDKTQVPVLSLFGSGSTQSPSQADMDRFDTLLVDIQDVGLRYYTYYITLYYLMDACAKYHKEVIVLDRPNPNGFYVDGPVLKDGFQSGVGKLPLPVVHGMTLGELAGMINGEGWLTGGSQCSLTVIPCKDYTHDTKANLITNPSPNLKDMQAIYMYASTCFFENTALSVGRGTGYPFEIYGSPYFADVADCDYRFTPQSMSGATNPPFQGQVCYGYDLRQKSRDEIFAEGICLDYLIDAYNTMQKVHPEVDFFGSPDKNGHYWIDLLSGSDELRKKIVAGKSSEEIKASWQAEIQGFMKQREPYLLYP